MPLFFRKGPEFEIENRGIGRPATCFPVDYDKSDLIEIMNYSGDWAEFYNTQTGETIKCSDFYEQLCKEREI